MQLKDKVAVVIGGTSELTVKGADVPAQQQNAPTGATNAE